MKAPAATEAGTDTTGTRHYRFGGYRVDTHARVLRDADGKRLPLTGRAFDALCHLIEHRDRIVGKDELLAAVWPGRVVEENNLAQAIAALRRALGLRAGEHRAVVTIPGRGYRFVAEVREDDGAGTAAGAPPPAIRAIAVLPFQPTLPDQRDEVLEWGLADTLITQLGSHRLAVRPLASGRRFAGPGQDPLAAGRELAADAVLEGSLQRHGDRLHVTARLLRVDDGAVLWSGRHDEPLERLPDIQDAIARAIAATLAQDTGAGLSRRQTTNITAYRLYLSGRYYVRKQTISDNWNAIALFKQAIDLDPAYALAYAGLAEAYRVLPINGDVAPHFAFPLARGAALRALEIDEHVAEARTGLAWVKFWHEWDWPGAEREARAAIAINPNDADAHYALAHLLYCIGRPTEALEHGRRARELDPLSPILGTLEAAFLFASGQGELGQRRLDETLAMAPDFWVAHLSRGGVLLHRGDHEAAIEAFTSARNLSGGSLHALSALGHIHGRHGRRDKARALLGELRTRGATQYVPATAVATIQIGLGEHDAALDSLELAHAQRDVGLAFIRLRHTWDALRSEPRFRSIAARMALDADAPAPPGSPVC